MLLTGLTIDCLEEILEYLELEDLLNTADSNKRLQHASKFVFIRKYGSHEFRINHPPFRVNKPSILRFDHYVSVHNLKFIFQLLRNFGILMSQINHHDRGVSLGMPPDSNYILDYINDFCGETLSYFQINMCERDVLNYFKNPFTEVKTVTIWAQYSEQKNRLIRLFPKMEKLTVRAFYNNRKCSEFVHSGCIAYHFPFLKYFKITTGTTSQLKKDNKCIEVFKDFLRLNPQIQHLHIECGNQVEVNILRVFEEREENPERLDLFEVDNFFNCFNGKKLFLKNVKHLSIESYCDNPFAEGIPILCNKLETFEIDLVGHFNEHIYDFCQNNSSIKRLNIGIYDRTDVNIFINFSKLAQSLPFLKEIINLKGKMSVVEVLHVLSLFKCLIYFRFISSDHFECKLLLSQLNNDWSMHITTKETINFITLKRSI